MRETPQRTTWCPFAAPEKWVHLQLLCSAGAEAGFHRSRPPVTPWCSHILGLEQSLWTILPVLPLLSEEHSAQ